MYRDRILNQAEITNKEHEFCSVSAKTYKKIRKSMDDDILGFHLSRANDK